MKWGICFIWSLESLIVIDLLNGFDPTFFMISIDGLREIVLDISSLRDSMSSEGLMLYLPGGFWYEICWDNRFVKSKAFLKMSPLNPDLDENDFLRTGIRVDFLF